MQVLSPAQRYWTDLDSAMAGNEATAHPLTSTLALNYRCNSRCSYCYIWKHHAENTPLADVELAIDQLARLGVLLISLTGGEPFLHPDLSAIVAHVRQTGRFAAVTTNGLLLSSKLRSVVDAGLNSLNISLDTTDPVLYQRLRGVPLNRVLRGLSVALAERERRPELTVGINCVVSRANIDCVPELVEYCRQVGISIGFQPLHGVFAGGRQENRELNFTPDDSDALSDLLHRLAEMKSQGYRITSPPAYLDGFPRYLIERRLRDGFRCNAGFVTIAIDHQLNVRSCWSMPPLGNLRDVDLVELWRSEAYRARRGDMLALHCPGCWLRCHTEERSSDWIDMLFKVAGNPEQRSQRHGTAIG